MIWLIKILKIYIEKHLLIKYYVIKHLILLYKDPYKDPKYDGYQPILASIVYKFFDKKILVVALKIKTFLIKS